MLDNFYQPLISNISRKSSTIMNLNLIAYLVYGLIILPVIIFVGRSCHLNGKPFIMHFAKDQKSIGNSISHLLLIGYYLVNIGFTIYIVSKWKQLGSNQETLESICIHIGAILLILAVLHYLNIIGITLFFKR